LRICIVTTSFPVHDGIAVGIHVSEHARHLMKMGVEVEVLAPHHYGAPRHEKMDGIPVHRFRYVWPERMQTLCYGAGIPTNVKNSLWAKCQIPALFISMFFQIIRSACRCDLIHAHWSLSGLPAIIAGKVLKKPVVVMMHGAEIYVLKASPFIKCILERADYVLCNSYFTFSKVLDMSTPKACKVISPGVDTQRFRPDVALSLFYSREPDIPRDRPLVFALGKFIARKGFTYLIDALAHIDEDKRPFLMMGGRGPLKKSLQAKVKQKGLSEHVKFLDYIPDGCIPAYYSAADAFVLPSIVDERDDTEGLGVVLLEALACETPCVASNVGGIVDIITDGFNGYLVEPKNSKSLAERIMLIVSDDHLRQNMGSKGRRFVKEKFSWSVKAKEILEVYKVILE